VKRRTQAAVVVQLLIMLFVLVPPLVVKYSGTTVYLETEKMDPRDLFRGDYVILGYRVAQNILPADEASSARRLGRPVYVTVTSDRPARFVAVSFGRPRLERSQACIVGRSRGQGSVDFPQIAQYFVPEGEGRVIERQRGEDLLARVSTSGRCNAVLTGLEAK